MKFYNRTKELKEINHFKNKKPSILVVTGRRRIGKTELIKRIHGHVYFYVDNKKSEAILISEYFNELKERFAIDPLIKIETWEEFIQLLFTLGKKKECIFVFDEFQRFLSINPSIINQFQKHWDLNHKNSKILFIFPGSSIGMIKKIFIENKAPLFKRAQNILYLKSFDFSLINQILDDFEIRNFEDKIKIYLMFGGVINYYALMDFYDVKNINEIFSKLILRRYAPLKNEIRDIIIEEFGKEHKTYYSILSALANGKTTKNEISNLVDIKATSLSPYLYDLIDLLDIVKYVLPVTKNPNSKKGRYFLKDNFFKFWFRFIFKNYSYYESENFSYINKIIKKNINSFFGLQFEDFCKEFVQNNFYDYPNVGKWWGHYRKDKKRKNLEIDICAINKDKKEILFGECKWKDNCNPEKIFQELKDKAGYVEWNKSNRREKFVIFAKSFSKKIKKNNLILYDLNAIKQIL
ncbi:AAA family ATPase [Candidatus Woesearchaeota archaeon]|nr:AAA family ATPase [Candidatus Woesearchaeota archaeon]